MGSGFFHKAAVWLGTCGGGGLVAQLCPTLATPRTVSDPGVPRDRSASSPSYPPALGHLRPQAGEVVAWVSEPRPTS